MRHHGKRVLLLNSSEEVIRTIPWERAISLIFSEKANAPYNYDHHYTILTANGTFKLPSALVLHEYVSMPYRHVLPTRKNIFARDGYVCQYTGEKLTWCNATIDHVMPRSRGGKHDWKNVVTCSRRVNIRKGARTPIEAGLKLARDPFVPTREHLVMNEVPEELKSVWSRWNYVLQT